MSQLLCRITFLLLLVVFALSGFISFTICSEQLALPQGFGLSSRYPGDVGIQNDPSVLFAENFEQGTIEEIAKRWGNISNKDGKVMSFSDYVPPESSGKRSLLMTATLGENTGGHLYTRFRGVDICFARFYVKFAEDCGYIHHFVTIGGYNPSTPWPQGGAGERPRGDDRITIGIEPFGDYGRFPPSGIWNFYCYWHEMKISADGKYWGNGLRPSKPQLVLGENGNALRSCSNSTPNPINLMANLHFGLTGNWLPILSRA